jgi:hypothetical protein
VTTGVLSATDVATVFNNAWTAANIDSSPAFQTEKTKKDAVAATAVPKAKSGVTLQQLVDLRKAWGRQLTGPKAASAKSSGGGGRAKKSEADRIQEASTFNNTAPPGVAFKYLHFSSKDGVIRGALRAMTSDKGYRILSKQFPLSSGDANLLKRQLDHYRSENLLTDTLYNQGVAELRSQGAQI